MTDKDVTQDMSHHRLLWYPTCYQYPDRVQHTRHYVLCLIMQSVFHPGSSLLT